MRREYLRAWHVKKQAAFREFIINLKQQPCLDCGNSYPFCAMDFDHVKGKKLRNIAKMVNSPKKALLEEIAKCELVCANCHRIRTFKRNNA